MPELHVRTRTMLRLTNAITRLRLDVIDVAAPLDGTIADELGQAREELENAAKRVYRAALMHAGAHVVADYEAATDNRTEGERG